MNRDHATPPWSTEAWRTLGGTAWLAQADRLEAMLAPVLDPLFEFARLQPGERVLDVGCGRGATTLQAARTVGPTGSVTAVDVSSDLIDEARTRASEEGGNGAAPIRWVSGDAQRVPLERHAFDAVISRFGIMFFDDPVDAFANLRGALRTGGRLAVATWRPRDACDFQSVGWQAISRVLIESGYEVPDVEPAAGPFRFGVEAFLRSLLSDAGWGEVMVHPIDLRLHFGGPGATPHDAVKMAMGTAGLQSFLGNYDDRAAELAAGALHEAFSAHHDGTGVRLAASILVTTATA